MNKNTISTSNRTIEIYEGHDDNIDAVTVQSFGDEWQSFHGFKPEEIALIGDSYFDIITPEMLNANTVMADFGCGSGRFTKFGQGKAKTIYAVDPSEAIFAADRLIGKDDDIHLVKASISNLPFDDNFFDFAMSIGVLHHIPNTQKAMQDCVRKVRKGGYFYTYLYYKLDNRGLLFRSLFWISNLFRLAISSMPQKLKAFCCDLTAVFFYMPFVFLARLLKAVGAGEKIWTKIPLSAYWDKSFYIIRNDALDRFGTPLEQRFSRIEIQQMMEVSGLGEIIFSENPGYWHAVGKKL
jgi:SAM-dependent methyltransferase